MIARTAGRVGSIRMLASLYLSTEILKHLILVMKFDDLN
jgi:hypothetical protein